MNRWPLVWLVAAAIVAAGCDDRDPPPAGPAGPTSFTVIGYITEAPPTEGVLVSGAAVQVNGNTVVSDDRGLVTIENLREPATATVTRAGYHPLTRRIAPPGPERFELIPVFQIVEHTFVDQIETGTDNCCAGGRTGPHKGHSVNHAPRNPKPLNRSYRHDAAQDGECPHIDSATDAYWHEALTVHERRACLDCADLDQGDPELAERRFNRWLTAGVRHERRGYCRTVSRPTDSTRRRSDVDVTTVRLPRARCFLVRHCLTCGRLLRGRGLAQSAIQLDQAASERRSLEEKSRHEIMSDLSARSDRFRANADTSRFCVELDDNSGFLVASKYRVVAMGRHILPLARVGGVLRRIAQRPADVSTISPVGVLSASAARRSGPGPTDGYMRRRFRRLIQAERQIALRRSVATEVGDNP